MNEGKIQNCAVHIVHNSTECNFLFETTGIMLPTVGARLAFVHSPLTFFSHKTTTNKIKNNNLLKYVLFL